MTALAEAAKTFEQTLDELGITGDEQEVDPHALGRRAALLAASDLVPRRTALAIEADAAAWTERSLRSAFAVFRDILGSEYALGVSALGADTCRLGGELADLVFLDWMSPQRLAWARGHIEKGSELRSCCACRGPQVVGCIRVHSFAPARAS